jgi:hypothetical protein
MTNFPKPHPVADLFPMIAGDEFEKFVENIKTNGVSDNLLPLSPDGKYLLDGRNRLAAARQLGIENQLKLVPQSRLDTEEKIVNFIIGRNLWRRHLTDIQRLEMAEATERFLAAAAKQRQGERTDLKRGTSPRNQGEVKEWDDRSNRSGRIAAKQYKVGHDNLAKWKVIKAKGSKQLIKDVRAEKISVNRAYQQVREHAPKPALDTSELAFVRDVNTKMVKSIEVISIVCSRLDNFAVDAERADAAKAFAAKLEEYAAALRRWAKHILRVVK